MYYLVEIKKNYIPNGAVSQYDTYKKKQTQRIFRSIEFDNS